MLMGAKHPQTPKHEAQTIQPIRATKRSVPSHRQPIHLTLVPAEASSHAPMEVP